MKIGYFADGEWAHRALQKIIECKEFRVVFIVPRFNSKDTILRKIAVRKNIPYLVSRDVNSTDFIDVIRGHSPDILVSMSFDQILKEPIITLAEKGFINCHAGALPFYRGRNVLNWVLINGEKSLGITVHYVDEGIDTGDIILQKHIDIELDDDYSTLLTKAYDGCAEILYEALHLLSLGNACAIKQTTIHPVGFYCGKRDEGDEWIKWDWPSGQIHNFVRALTSPGPCARTSYKNDTIAIVKTQLIEHAPLYINTVGEVVGKDDNGVIIKTGDSTLKVLKIASISDNHTLHEFTVPKYIIGTRLGFKTI